MWVIEDPAGGAPILESRVCPLPLVPARIWQLFRLYRLYCNGVLLTAGGLLQQPAYYLEAMELIEQAQKNG